jgi:hypothetical protein
MANRGGPYPNITRAAEPVAGHAAVFVDLDLARYQAGPRNRPSACDVSAAIRVCSCAQRRPGPMKGEVDL